MSRTLLPEEIDRILEQAEVGRLGLSANGNPYVIPLSFWLGKDAIYFHGALQGRKIEYIRANPRACFVADRMDELLKSAHPCQFNVTFQSAMVEGDISLVEDEAEKLVALKGLSAKYGGPESAALMTHDQTRNVAVFKLLIQEKSGRGNP